LAGHSTKDSNDSATARRITASAIDVDRVDVHRVADHPARASGVNATSPVNVTRPVDVNRVVASMPCVLARHRLAMHLPRA
jgi:hypothetical protein